MFTYTLELAEKLRTGIVMAFKPINSKPERKGKGFTLEIYNDLLDRQIAGIKMKLSPRVRRKNYTNHDDILKMEGALKQCQYLKQEVNGWYDYDAIT